MVSMASVRQEIEARNAEFVAAFKRGDAAAVAACYTDDATVMPPGAAMVKGRAAIQQFWQSAREMGIKDAKLDTLSVETAGDLACEIGSATLLIEPAGGQATNEVVKYCVVWKRQPNGPWQLHIDIWNADS